MNQEEFLLVLNKFEIISIKKHSLKTLATLGGNCFNDWITAEGEYEDLKKKLIKIARGES